MVTSNLFKPSHSSDRGVVVNEGEDRHGQGVRAVRLAAFQERCSDRYGDLRRGPCSPSKWSASAVVEVLSRLQGFRVEAMVQEMTQHVLTKRTIKKGPRRNKRKERGDRNLECTSARLRCCMHKLTSESLSWGRCRLLEASGFPGHASLTGSGATTSMAAAIRVGGWSLRRP